MSEFSGIVQGLAAGFPDPLAASFRLDSIEYALMRGFSHTPCPDERVRWYRSIAAERQLIEVARVCSECILPQVPLAALDEAYHRASHSKWHFTRMLREQRISRVYERVKSYREETGQPFPINLFSHVIEDELLMFTRVETGYCLKHRSEGQRIGSKKTAS